MLWHFYLRNDTAFVPTMGQTEAGFYLDIEPVEVVPAKDIQALRGAIQQAINRGNPRVSTPSRATFPKPVVLRHAKVKSWSAFEKGAMNWKVIEKDGNYQIKPGRKHPERGWEDDPTQTETLLPGTTVDTVAQRVASLMQVALGIGTGSGDSD
jgi:hypothetical protein